MTIIDFRPRQLAARNAENIKRARMLVEGDTVVNDFVELLVSKSTKWPPEQRARRLGPLHGTMKAVKDIIGFVQR